MQEPSIGRVAGPAGGLPVGARLRQRLAQGRPVYSLLHGLSCPAVAELAALAGYDAVIIDDEHGHGGRREYLAMVQAVAAGGAACLLRLATHDPLAIGQALDLGVDGLLISGIRDARQAAAVVSASRYPPQGTRGYGLAMARASGYGLYPKQYDASVSDGVFLTAIIESQEGVDNAGAIAGTPGIDAVLVGMQDLSADMGFGGDLSHPRVRAALAQVEDEVRAAGKALGSAVFAGVTLPELLARGHRFITLGVDTRLLGQAMRQQLVDCPDRMRTAEP